MAELAPAPVTPAACVRDRIVAAAVEVLHQQGINALTQARVSELAGVRQSHLTYYFPTRNDLLQQAVVAGTASLLGALEGPAGERAQSLGEFRDDLAAQIADRRVPRMFAGLVVASEEDPSLKRWLERFETDLCDRLLRALRARGLRPKRVAVEMFQATVVGALQLDLAASSAASRRRTHAILNGAFAQLVAGSAAAATAVRRSTTTRRTARPAR
jgi:AcrR family transcriptional regulator